LSKIVYDKIEVEYNLPLPTYKEDIYYLHQHLERI
jgi:hypothetical protein